MICEARRLSNVIGGATVFWVIGGVTVFWVTGGVTVFWVTGDVIGGQDVIVSGLNFVNVAALVRGGGPKTSVLGGLAAPRCSAWRRCC